jgi:hypothetical protein
MNATDPASSGCELLYGAQRIALFLSLQPRQVYYLQKKGELPTFKVGQLLCARPGTLRAWLAKREASARRAV